MTKKYLISLVIYQLVKFVLIRSIKKIMSVENSKSIRFAVKIEQNHYVAYSEEHNILIEKLLDFVIDPLISISKEEIHKDKKNERFYVEFTNKNRLTRIYAKYVSEGPTMGSYPIYKLYQVTEASNFKTKRKLVRIVNI